MRIITDITDNQMKKNAVAFLLVLLLLLSFPCAYAEQDGAEKSNSAAVASAALQVTDMIGRKLEVIPGSYTGIVCIGAGALRMYCYIGDADLLCGVEDIDNESLKNRPQMFDSVARPYMLAYGSDFTVLPSCGVGGPNAQTAEAEKILSCGADLVISCYEDVEKADALQEQLGVPVVTLATGPDGVFDEKFYGSMELLGKVLGRSDRADALVSFVQNEKQAIAGRTEAVAEADRPTVYICGLGNWGTTDHLTTSENYVSFRVANVNNAVTGLGSGVRKIDAEKFESLAGSMDLMFIDAAAVKNIAPLYASDSTMFDSCKAWQNGEVYLQMAYNVYYTNFEIALMNTWYIAKTVYPEQFSDVDMVEKTNEITEMFLGRALADEIFACPASFGGYQRIDTASFFK